MRLSLTLGRNSDSRKVTRFGSLACRLGKRRFAPGSRSSALQRFGAHFGGRFYALQTVEFSRHLRFRRERQGAGQCALQIRWRQP